MITEASPIEDLEMAARTINCLRNDGIYTVGDVLACSEQTFLRIPGFGQKSIKDLKGALACHGLSISGVVPSRHWHPAQSPVAALTNEISQLIGQAFARSRDDLRAAREHIAGLEAQLAAERERVAMLKRRLGED